MYEHLARRALPQVLAPFALILGFRALYHPLVEWLLAGAIDIGTAHLWFVLMVGLGRLICWLLAALSALRPPVALRWPCASATPSASAAATATATPAATIISSISASAAASAATSATPATSTKRSPAYNLAARLAALSMRRCCAAGPAVTRGDAATTARARAPRLCGGAAVLLLTWRLTLAPTHIGLRWLPTVRMELYHLLFGDRNYLQVHYLLYYRNGDTTC